MKMQRLVTIGKSFPIMVHERFWHKKTLKTIVYAKLSHYCAPERNRCAMGSWVSNVDGPKGAVEEFPLERGAALISTRRAGAVNGPSSWQPDVAQPRSAAKTP
jgi:hypothetical protein